jgi:hypothetical protein
MKTRVKAGVETQQAGTALHLSSYYNKTKHTAYYMQLHESDTGQYSLPFAFLITSFNDAANH